MRMKKRDNDCIIWTMFIDSDDRNEVIDRYCKNKCKYRCINGKDYSKQEICHCGCNYKIRKVANMITYKNNLLKQKVYFKDEKHFKNWIYIKEQRYADSNINKMRKS